MGQNARRRWRIISYFFRAAYLFRNCQVRKFSNVADLVEDIESSPNNSPVLKKKPSATQTAISQQRSQDAFYNLCVSGTQSETDDILKLLQSDPKRFVTSDKNQWLINRKNMNGHTPLYLASKHANVDVVKFLLEHHANPKLKSTIGNNEEESWLTVACRWGYINVVKILINLPNWRRQDFSEALAGTSNTEIQKLLIDARKNTKKVGCWS